MFIVQHIPSGKYFRKGPHFTIKKLVDKKENATIFRNHSGVLNCVGTWTKLDQPIRKGKFRLQYGKMILNEAVWKVIPVSIDIDYGEEAGEY